MKKKKLKMVLKAGFPLNFSAAAGGKNSYEVIFFLSVCHHGLKYTMSKSYKARVLLQNLLVKLNN